MEILYLLVPVSILFVFAIGLIFWWALNNRQFDALDDVSERLLNDIDTPAQKSAEKLADQKK